LVYESSLCFLWNVCMPLNFPNKLLRLHMGIAAMGLTACTVLRMFNKKTSLAFVMWNSAVVALKNRADVKGSVARHRINFNGPNIDYTWHVHSPLLMIAINSLCFLLQKRPSGKMKKPAVLADSPAIRLLVPSSSSSAPCINSSLSLLLQLLQFLFQL
jgi:hypothetical protein